MGAGGFCQQIVRTQPWDLWGVFCDTYPDPPEVHRLSDQLVVLRYLFLGGKLHKAFADLSTQPVKAQRDFTKRLLIITVLVQRLFFFNNGEWQFAQSYFNPVYRWHLLCLRFHSVLITDKSSVAANDCCFKHIKHHLPIWEVYKWGGMNTKTIRWLKIVPRSVVMGFFFGLDRVFWGVGIFFLVQRCQNGLFNCLKQNTPKNIVGTDTELCISSVNIGRKSFKVFLLESLSYVLNFVKVCIFKKLLYFTHNFVRLTQYQWCSYITTKIKT